MPVLIGFAVLVGLFAAATYNTGADQILKPCALLGLRQGSAAVHVRKAVALIKVLCMHAGLGKTRLQRSWKSDTVVD